MNWLIKISQSIPLSSVEQQIINIIKEASLWMPLKPTTRIAGGWCRDKLLGRPSKDIDITIDNMKGIDFANLLRQYAVQKFGHNQTIVTEAKDTEARPEQIKNLAVAFLRIYGQDVEILNLRGNEIYEEGNRNPISTTEASPEQDAYRRDLTINSLFYNINTGQIEDFTGRGKEDLKTMTLRTPLDPIKTFVDDPLRVLRVLRFYSRYQNSNIAPEVIEAMKDPQVQFQITRKISNPNDPKGIVVERTSEEFRKMMKGEQPEKAIQILYGTGLLGKILNLPQNFSPLEMNQQNKHHELTLVEHLIQVIKNVNKISKEYGLNDNERMMMNFAALFHDIGKLDPRTHLNKPSGERGYSGNPNNPNSVTHEIASSDQWKNFAKAMKLSTEETLWIGDLIEGHMKPHAHFQEDMNDKGFRRYLRKNPNWTFQYIHSMADAMSRSEKTDPSVIDPYKTQYEKLKTLAPTANPNTKANDLLNGGEIMNIVGLPASPPKGMVGYIEVIKERIREKQDENPSLTKDEAVQIAKQMLFSGELDAYKTQSKMSNWLCKLIKIS